MSARIVLAVAALAVAPAWADERGGSRETSGVERESPMERAAPMERAESFSSAPAEWTKSDNGPDLRKSEPSDSTPSESRGTQWAADSSSGSRAHARSSSSGRSSSGASARHSGGRSGGDRGGSHGGSSAPPRSGAQARHPRPGTGTGDFDNGHHGYYGGNRYYGNGYRYGYGYGYGWPYYGYGRYGYYYPYNYWYSPYYYSGYYGYAPAYFSASFGYGGDYHGHSHGDSGSVRILVDPAKARVYVDGSYAGIVDDFDGVFQRLNVPTGRHEITLKLEGYRTQHFNVYVPVDDTIKIHFDMVRGSGEATSEEFVGRPEDYRRAEEMNERDREGRDDRDYRDDRDAASVRLQVNPRDASVYVDGEFHGSGRDSSSLRLRPGRHRIEVVRPGFRTLERDVDVEPGRGADVQVDLEKL